MAVGTHGSHGAFNRVRQLACGAGESATPRSRAAGQGSNPPYGDDDRRGRPDRLAGPLPRPPARAPSARDAVASANTLVGPAPGGAGRAPGADARDRRARRLPAVGAREAAARPPGRRNERSGRFRCPDPDGRRRPAPPGPPFPSATGRRCSTPIARRSGGSSESAQRAPDDVMAVLNSTESVNDSDRGGRWVLRKEFDDGFTGAAPRPSPARTPPGPTADPKCGARLLPGRRTRRALHGRRPARRDRHITGKRPARPDRAHHGQRPARPDRHLTDGGPHDPTGTSRTAARTTRQALRRRRSDRRRLHPPAPRCPRSAAPASACICSAVRPSSTCLCSAFRSSPTPEVPSARTGPGSPTGAVESDGCCPDARTRGRFPGRRVPGRVILLDDGRSAQEGPPARPLAAGRTDRSAASRTGAPPPSTPGRDSRTSETLPFR